MKRRASSKTQSRSWLFWLVGVFFSLLPFLFSPAGFDKFRAPKDIALGFFALVLLAAFLASRKLEFQRLPTRWNLGLALMLGYVAVHVLFLGRPQVSSSALFSLLGASLLLILLAEILDADSQLDLWLMAGIAVSINAVLTILQYFGLFPLMERMGGSALSGRLIPAGMIGEVNSGGFLFALMALLALGGIFSQKQILRRSLWAAILVANTLGLIFTRTLTAVVGLALCLGLWVIWQHWWILVKKGASRSWILAFWAIVLIGGSLAVLAATRAGLTERILVVSRQISRGNLNAATAGRQPVYLLTWQMIKERPILGHGLASFSQDFFNFRADSKVGQSVKLINQSGAFQQVHNEYLQIWEELGLVGLLGWLALLGALLWHSLSSAIRSQDRSQSFWCFHLFLGLVLVCITSLSFFPFQVGVTTAFILLLAASVRSYSEPRQATPALLENWQKRIPRYAFLGAGILLVTLAAWRSIDHWRANVETGHAAELLEAAIQRPPGRTRSVQVSQALALLDRAQKWNPGIPEIENLRGTGHFLAGRYAESIQHYRKAIGLIPSPEIYTNLAAALIAAQEKAAAREFLEKALRYNPDYAPARQALETLQPGT